VFTVLPHFVLRYRKMRPEVARDALLATHGGLSLAWCAVICHISPMALYRALPRDLCPGPTEFGHGVDPVYAVFAGVSLGR
jgi:hypothetical protein